MTIVATGFGGIAIFCAFGSQLLHKSPEFDIFLQTFYPAGKRKGAISPEESVAFGQLQKLEISCRWVHSSKNSYMCYMLDVLTKNEARYNLLSHGAYSPMLRDAEKLSRALNLPLEITPQTISHVQANRRSQVVLYLIGFFILLLLLFQFLM